MLDNPMHIDMCIDIPCWERVQHEAYSNNPVPKFYIHVKYRGPTHSWASLASHTYVYFHYNYIPEDKPACNLVATCRMYMGLRGLLLV